jgi:hypothetical protein
MRIHRKTLAAAAAVSPWPAGGVARACTDTGDPGSYTTTIGITGTGTTTTTTTTGAITDAATTVATRTSTRRTHSTRRSARRHARRA